MKVQELIHQLRQHDEDMTIVVSSGQGNSIHDVESVEKRKIKRKENPKSKTKTLQDCVIITTK